MVFLFDNLTSTGPLHTYGSVIKLSKMEVILQGLKMEELFTYKLNVKGAMSKYDNMMVIEGVGVRQPSKMYDVKRVKKKT